jgi:hypothetical protein
MSYPEHLGKGNKQKAFNWKGRIKIISIARQHDFICRKPYDYTHTHTQLINNTSKVSGYKINPQDIPKRL